MFDRTYFPCSERNQKLSEWLNFIRVLNTLADGSDRSQPSCSSKQDTFPSWSKLQGTSSGVHTDRHLTIVVHHPSLILATVYWQSNNFNFNEGVNDL